MVQFSEVCNVSIALVFIDGIGSLLIWIIAKLLMWMAEAQFRSEHL